ncbi:MAG: hypothetical protein ACOY3P_20155 [Planctomycetota bacterium]
MPSDLPLPGEEHAGDPSQESLTILRELRETLREIRRENREIARRLESMETKDTAATLG